jgi:hypothetical protein
VDTRTHTPVRPSRAERARTVLAAAASASVLWDGGRVDLLGCHHDDPLGDVILTLESTSTLVRAAREAVGGDLAVTIELTELCAMNAHQRVRARITLGGQLSELPATPPTRDPSSPSSHLLARIREVNVEEAGAAPAPVPAPVPPELYRATAEPDPLPTGPVPLALYRAAEPDPLHAGAAEQLQHLAAHHPDAITTLTRLCDRPTLIGATRVLPIALDRYGIVLRIERLRDHHDVRLPFSRRIDTGTEAAIELRALLARGAGRRPCGR